MKSTILPCLAVVCFLAGPQAQASQKLMNTHWQDNDDSSCPSLANCEKLCPLFGHKRDQNHCEICECVQWNDKLPVEVETAPIRGRSAHDTSSSSGSSQRHASVAMYEDDIRTTASMRYWLLLNTVHGLESLETGEQDTKMARGAPGNVPLWQGRKEGDYYVVPYELGRSLTNSYAARRAIEKAAQDLEKHTCIRLRPRQGREFPHIQYFAGGGCYSAVGQVESVQQISIGTGCEYKGTVLHETMHALGFWHEQSRNDRDEHVIIQWSNIIRGMSYNFNKKTKRELVDLDTEYDIQSVMHYPATAFTSNGQPTITDLNYRPVKTQREGLSPTDIKELNALYGCSKDGTGQPVTERACWDRNSQCLKWARNGACTNWYHRDYMAENCPCSCKAIVNPTKRPTTTTQPPTTTTTEATTTTTTTVVSSCVDIHIPQEKCRTWYNQGLCTDARYEVWLKKNCCASCSGGGTLTTTTEPTTTTIEFTTTTTTESTTTTTEPTTTESTTTEPTTTTTTTTTEFVCSGDLDSGCQTWSRLGYCQDVQYSYYMLEHCCESCKKVSTTTTVEPTTSTTTTELSTTTTEEPECEGRDNLEDSCDYWANLGYCSDPMYEYYMTKTCCGSCYQEPTTTTTTTTPAPTTTTTTTTPAPVTTTDTCTDNNRYCGDWARRGECSKNPNYMRPNCCRSCRAVGAIVTAAPASSCRDQSQHCGYWASSGECQKNPAYMNTNCCDSCRQAQRGTLKVCADDPTLPATCAFWSQFGFCRDWQIYSTAKQHCAKSCGFCGVRRIIYLLLSN